MILLNKKPEFSPLAVLLVIALLISTASAGAQSAPKAETDILVLSNGDTLHGKLVNEVGGKVTFHTDSLGDVSVGWDKIKELHAAGVFTVLDNNFKPGSKKHASQVPTGSVDVADGSLTVHGANAPAPIPVKNAQFIIDAPTFETQLNHSPNFLTGWNGAASAGATLVRATQNQYTVSGALGLIRVVPTASWLTPRNRTTAAFSGSYGKITQPAYSAGGVVVAPAVTKSAIFHLAAERDEYFSPRFFVLAQTAFDHNYAQDLQLQQIYGAGMGWTVFSTPRQQADLKGTMQYEREQFINSAA